MQNEDDNDNLTYLFHYVLMYPGSPVCLLLVDKFV